ncbi:MAG: hypothetical protein ABIK23_07725 [candidate division WOR-3 bacterium]
MIKNQAVIASKSEAIPLPEIPSTLRNFAESYKRDSSAGSE